MDTIAEIIQALTAEEITAFKDFIQTKKELDNRKDLQLFELLAQNNMASRDTILQQLYPGQENLIAYHATRKRLFKMLSHFLHTQKIQRDEHLDLAAYISVCTFLFKNRQEEIGWRYLNKALTMISKRNLVDLEIQFYQLAIQEANSIYAPPIKELITTYQELVKQRHEESQLQIMRQVARHELNQRLKKGSQLDFAVFIQELNETFLPNSSTTQSLQVVYSQVCITRSVVLAKKEFYTFENYIINAYNDLLLENVFDQETNTIKIHFLYMLAHTCYRNKNFDRAQSYLDQMQTAMNDFAQKDLKKYQYTFVLLQSAVYSYSNASAKSIVLLETLLKEKSIQRNNAHYFNGLINLCLNYFYNKEYNRTQRTFRNLQHTDAWFVKIMGQEWVLKKLLLEAINFYELSHEDLALEKIKTIEKHFKPFMNQDPHKRALHFVTLFKKIIHNPDVVSTQSFRHLVNNTFTFLPHEEEDLQAMAFFAWLKAKMLRREFYEVLQEIVKG